MDSWLDWVHQMVQDILPISSHPSTNQARPCLASEIGYIQGGLALDFPSLKIHSLNQI